MRTQIIKKTIVFFLMYASFILAVGWRNEVEIVGMDCPNVFDPQIAVNSTIVHIIYRNNGQDLRCYQPCYGRSTDTGEKWSEGYIGYFTTYGGTPYSVNIATCENNVFCIGEYTLFSNPGTFFAKSSDNGLSWVSSYISRGALETQPVIAANVNDDAIYVHAGWTDWREGNGNPEIYYSKSTNGGDSWNEQELVSASDTTWLPDIAVNNNYIHVVWADKRNTGNFEIYYKRYYSGSWGNDVRLTNLAGRSWFPSIAIYGDNVYLVWQDDRAVNPGVYYRKSTNNGTSWQSETYIGPMGHHPDIAVDANGIYVVYDKDNEIFYREYIIGWSTPNQITLNFVPDSFPQISANTLGRNVIYTRGAWLSGKVWFKQLDTYCLPPTNLHTDQSVPPPVALLWDASLEPANYFDEYDIYRRLLPNGTFGLLTSTTNTYYNDNNVSYGSTYEYYITAKDIFNNISTPSNVIQVYIPDPSVKKQNEKKDNKTSSVSALICMGGRIIYKNDTPSDQDAQYSLYDITGKMIQGPGRLLSKSTGNEYAREARALNPGIYFLKIDAGDRSTIKKLIVIK